MIMACVIAVGVICPSIICILGASSLSSAFNWLSVLKGLVTVMAEG